MNPVFVFSIFFGFYSLAGASYADEPLSEPCPFPPEYCSGPISPPTTQMPKPKPAVDDQLAIKPPAALKRDGKVAPVFSPEGIRQDDHGGERLKKIEIEESALEKLRMRYGH